MRDIPSLYAAKYIGSRWNVNRNFIAGVLDFPGDESADDSPALGLIYASSKVSFCRSLQPSDRGIFMSMLRFSFITLVICLLAGLARADVQAGDKPSLHFKDFLTQKSVDLTDLHGKIVVVDFWATWCKPCMAEADHLVAVNTKYADKGVQFLGISLDSDSQALKTVMTERKFVWPMSFEGLGWDGSIPKAWGITGIPQTFVISPDGEVLWRGFPQQIEAALDKALIDHPPQLVDPKTLAQAKTILDQAEKDLTNQQPAKALKLIASFPEAAKLDGAVASRLKTVIDQLQDFGNGELTAIDPLIASGQYADAIQKLRDLSQAFNGTAVATAARTKLASLGSDPKVQKVLETEKTEKAAADQLVVANRLKAEKKDELAYPRFKAIVKSFPNTAAGNEAAGDVKSYEADTAFIARINQKSNAKKADSMMSMADNYRAAGNTAQAREKYQAVVDQFPNSTWAAAASKALADLGN
jgi:thiol-disulfide isomerase/thioredoxin